METRNRGRRSGSARLDLAIDSKLRGCDLVALRVDDVALNGYAKDRASIRPTTTSAAPIAKLAITCSQEAEIRTGPPGFHWRSEYGYAVRWYDVLTCCIAKSRVRFSRSNLARIAQP